MPSSKVVPCKMAEKRNMYRMNKSKLCFCMHNVNIVLKPYFFFFSSRQLTLKAFFFLFSLPGWLFNQWSETCKADETEGSQWITGIQNSLSGIKGEFLFWEKPIREEYQGGKINNPQ